LQRLFPQIKVDGDRIFLRYGAIWTSAGISAGIDFALAMIEDDLGPQYSRATTRELVVYYRRPGGQSQFSTLLELDPDSDRIRTVMAYMQEHLNERLPVEGLAQFACLSTRQFARSFIAATEKTSAKVVERLRAEAARSMIEMSVEPI
jgi:transcriptional regulator GlxA family with amidase domain